MSLLEVTPHAYPAYKEEAGIVFSCFFLLCMCVFRSQDPQFGSPTASPFRERQAEPFAWWTLWAGAPLWQPAG